MPGRPTHPFSPSRFLWVGRVLWAATAVGAVLAVGDATEGAGSAALAATVVLWACLAAAVVSLIVPSPLGLSVLRAVTPLAVPAAALLLGHGGGALAAVTGLLGLVTSLVVMSAEFGEAMVQASAYGDERRFPLRTPAALLPPIGLSWAVWAAALLGGVTAVAHRAWAAGGALLFVAALLGWFLAPRIHRFSRRWLVVVPAGVVVHDHVVLGETLMVQRTNVQLARLALAGTEAADLTGPAGGHALDIAVKDMVLAVFPASKREPKGRAIHVQSFLVAPARPGRALTALADSKLPVA